MMRDSRIPERIKERIQHLVDVHAISIKATKDEPFVAYSGSVALTYNACLFVKTLTTHIAVEAKNRPTDMLAKVAEILTKYAEVLKRY